MPRLFLNKCAVAVLFFTPSAVAVVFFTSSAMRVLLCRPLCGFAQPYRDLEAAKE
jgi:hypothetical protein